MIDQRTIDQIIESNDIVSIVEQYLPLKKTGSNFKACCPFHEEKTASFVVSDKKQIFKCFGCGKGGNVIHFVKEMENITFFESLEKLAQRAGIKLRQDSKAVKKQQSRQNLLLKVYDLAKDHYCDNLERFGDSVFRYLEERGISRATSNRFELGYALNGSRSLYNYLIKCSINNKILESSGLFSSSQSGLSDVFRERLMFPIHSSNGNVVAFGARVLSDNIKTAKYINSPTTELYTKGNELYGFYLTKNEIRKQDFALVTEGYTDFFRLYEAGFTNSAAVLGTSFTDNQIKLLTRYTNNILLVFDADPAGRKAAVKAAGKITAAGAEPKIVSLPDGEDADSFFTKHGKEEMQELIDKAKTVTEYLYHNNDLSLSIKEKLEMLLETANEIPDALNRELFIKDIAKVFDVSVSSLSQRISSGRRAKETKKQNTDKPVLSTDQKEEKAFLTYLINGLIDEPDDLIEIDSSFFFNETYKKIFETLKSFDYIIDSERIASFLADLEEKDSIQVRIISELSLADVPPVSFKEIVNELKIRKYKNDLKNIDHTSSPESDESFASNRHKDLVVKMRNSARKVIP